MLKLGSQVIYTQIEWNSKLTQEYNFCIFTTHTHICIEVVYIFNQEKFDFNDNNNNGNNNLIQSLLED